MDDDHSSMKREFTLTYCPGWRQLKPLVFFVRNKFLMGGDFALQ